MADIEQECGEPSCIFYGTPDDPNLKCPDEHIKDRHPAATDLNWKPSTYRYRDSKLNVIWTTQTPIDDESALAEFHRLSRMQGYAPQYVERAEPGEHNKFQMLPYQFINGAVEKIG